MVLQAQLARAEAGSGSGALPEVEPPAAGPLASAAAAVAAAAGMVGEAAVVGEEGARRRRRSVRFVEESVAANDNKGP